MNKIIKKSKLFFNNYLESFKRVPQKVLMADLFCFGSIIGFLYLMKYLISYFGELLLPIGTSQDELKAFVLNNSMDKVKAIVGKVQLFSIVFSVILILGIFFLTYLYFNSREKVWSYFLKKHHKKLFFKFILFLILSFLILFVSFLIYLLIMSLLVLLVSTLTHNNPNYISITRSLTLFVGYIFFLLLFYEFKHNFFKSTLIWSSIGKSFSNFWRNFKKIIKLMCVLVITLVIINFIVLSIIEKIFSQNSIVYLIFQSIIFILFLSWSRNYFYQTVKGDLKHHKS